MGAPFMAQFHRAMSVRARTRRLENRHRHPYLVTKHPTPLSAAQLHRPPGIPFPLAPECPHLAQIPGATLPSKASPPNLSLTKVLKMQPSGHITLGYPWIDSGY